MNHLVALCRRNAVVGIALIVSAGAGFVFWWMSHDRDLTKAGHRSNKWNETLEASIDPKTRARLLSAPSAGGGSPAVELDVPELTLVGTLVGVESGQGWALGQTGDGVVRIYRPGQSLPGGARLQSVHENHVVLDRNDVREFLGESSRLGDGTTTFSPDIAGATEVSMPELRTTAGLGFHFFDESVEPMLRPQPTFSDGVFQGYRIYPGRDRAKFNRVGLRPGDLVLEVNGVALVDADGGDVPLRAVSHGQPAILTVDRGVGQLMQIFVD